MSEHKHQVHTKMHTRKHIQLCEKEVYQKWLLSKEIEIERL